ncbi:pyridoxal phosphate-dependent transferase [Zygosaccharomyces rouxii]|nr:pyridoxal phosphate-dependent transferase [Zygosaccharomyces rouxii]
MKLPEETKALLRFDREHIWHPYTSMVNPLPVHLVKEAYDCELILETQDGSENRVIDGMSSWWCAIHGYNHKELNDALISQASQMSHVMFGGLTHRPAINLVQKLLKMMNHKELQHCFLADSGSVAVEVAMKMALQYHFTLGKPKKSKFLTISSGYHGDTTGAMSVCDPVGSMHSIYKGYLAENIFARGPSMIPVLPTSGVFRKYGKSFGDRTSWKEDDINDVRDKIENHHDELCAVILEPILQGAGGMRLYHPQFLIEVRKLCNRYHIPLILDEIATGFGRTGTTFAFHHCQIYQEQNHIPREMQIDVYPDIICVGKALTGGYLTLSAVVTTPKIALGISSPSSPTGGCMMHGPTFMGNPLACAVANKSLDILMCGYWKQQVDRIEEQLFEELFVPLMEGAAAKELWLVEDVRIVGAVGVIELKVSIDQEWFQEAFISKGVYIRPFRNLCYIMPPYIISKEQLRKLTTGLVSALREWHSVRANSTV